jgi:hypothetical protein
MRHGAETTGGGRSAHQGNKLTTIEFSLIHGMSLLLVRPGKGGVFAARLGRRIYLQYCRQFPISGADALKYCDAVARIMSTKINFCKNNFAPPLIFDKLLL